MLPDCDRVSVIGELWERELRERFGKPREAVIAEADVVIVIGDRLFETAPALRLGVEPVLPDLGAPACRHREVPPSPYRYRRMEMGPRVPNRRGLSAGRLSPPAWVPILPTWISIGSSNARSAAERSPSEVSSRRRRPWDHMPCWDPTVSPSWRDHSAPAPIAPDLGRSGNRLTRSAEGSSSEVWSRPRDGR